MSSLNNETPSTHADDITLPQLEERQRAVVSLARRLFLQGCPPEKALKEIVRAQWGFATAARACLEKDPKSGSNLLEELRDELLAELVRGIRRGQQAGSFHEIDASSCASRLLNLIDRAVPQEGGADSLFLVRRADFIVALALEALWTPKGREAFLKNEL